jgi:mannosyltransferase
MQDRVAVPIERPTPAPAMPVKEAPQPWDALVVALLAIALSAAGSDRPRFSGDELATISSSTRSLPDLWKMLGAIDTHQGLYYLLMHVWHAVFPVTEFVSRLSSALAVGVAAAGVVVLGKQVSTRAVAVTAGVVFAVLPRVTYAGADARPYALSMAAAVWLTVFCVMAARRGQPRWWLAYSVLLTGATLINLHLLLIAPAHAVAVRAFGRTPRALHYWAAATTGAVTLMAPYLLFSKSNFSGTWIPSLSSYTVRQIVQHQYFGAEYTVNPVAVSAVAAVILVAGLVVAIRSGASRPTSAVALALTWIVVPTGILLAVSLFHPSYYPRYLSFTAPALALLLGMCVVTVGRSRAGITALLIVFAVAAAPSYLAQRQNAFARNDQAYDHVSEIIDRYADYDDCLLVEDAGVEPGTNSKRWPPLRSMLVVRPTVYEKLTDHGREPWNFFFDGTKPVSGWAEKLRGCPAIWTITDRDWSLPEHQRGPQLPPGPFLEKTESYKVPSRFGFHVVERWQFRSSQVTRSTR